METLIRRRLTASDFGELLTTFDGEPAIFYRKAPDDSTELNYPHAIFSVDKFSDAIHGVAGFLTVEIICTQETLSPETLEKSLRQALEGVFFNPDGGEIFQLKWQKSDVFREPASERLPLIIGAEATFEVREFPSSETASPDPIQALNLWTSRWNSNAIVIGLSETPEIFEPTIDVPAFYFDAQRTRMTGQTHAATWLETVATAHIFCPGVNNRRRWIAAIFLGLLNTRAIFLTDGTPIRITACEQNFAADEIQGQLSITLEYGALRPLPYAHPLTEKAVNMDGVIRCTQSTN